MKKVKLEDIIEAMELVNDDSNYYYNKMTGEITYVDDETRRLAEDCSMEDLESLPDWQRDDVRAAIDVEENRNYYIALPSKFDINEYDIMVEFCYSLDNDKVSNRLLSVLNGKGAFRRFKDTTFRLNVEEKWYEFRDEALRKIALDWCSCNRIEIENN
ncbi:UPF0158 family protein [Clostridium sp. AWRP]|uniref:UPF0158 family protein n=1 Tax=Clostridium sp. AWRP TaxID=2212991 RepID=UPI000FD87ECC|nr:UPF0158 family protein [Clostridium sp. AWRP]AZV59051.1 hypothetical protein DMR38_07355 [Clostridium sp. AWRP]